MILLICSYQGQFEGSYKTVYCWLWSVRKPETAEPVPLACPSCLHCPKSHLWGDTRMLKFSLGVTFSEKPLSFPKLQLTAHYRSGVSSTVEAVFHFESYFFFH